MQSVDQHLEALTYQVADIAYNGSPIYRCEETTCWRYVRILIHLSSGYPISLDRNQLIQREPIQHVLSFQNMQMMNQIAPTIRSLDETIAERDRFLSIRLDHSHQPHRLVIDISVYIFSATLTCLCDSLVTWRWAWSSNQSIICCVVWIVMHLFINELSNDLWKWRVDQSRWSIAKYWAMDAEQSHHRHCTISTHGWWVISCYLCIILNAPPIFMLGKKARRARRHLFC